MFSGVTSEGPATCGAPGGGQASLWLQTTGNGSTLVRMDLDGDGSDDVQLLIGFVSGLTEDDFLL